MVIVGCVHLALHALQLVPKDAGIPYVMGKYLISANELTLRAVTQEH